MYGFQGTVLTGGRQRIYLPPLVMVACLQHLLLALINFANFTRNPSLGIIHHSPGALFLAPRLKLPFAKDMEIPQWVLFVDTRSRNLQKTTIPTQRPFVQDIQAMDLKDLWQ